MLDFFGAVVPVPAAVVGGEPDELVGLLERVVVEVLLGAETGGGGVGDVGTVGVGACPSGFETRNCSTACAPGGLASVVPLATKPNVISWPLRNRMAPALPGATRTPLLALGDDQTSTCTSPGWPAQRYVPAT